MYATCSMHLSRLFPHTYLEPSGSGTLHSTLGMRSIPTSVCRIHPRDRRKYDVVSAQAATGPVSISMYLPNLRGVSSCEIEARSYSRPDICSGEACDTAPPPATWLRLSPTDSPNLSGLQTNCNHRSNQIDHSRSPRRDGIPEASLYSKA